MPRGLARRITIEAPRQHHRLIGNHANGLTFEANKAAKNVLGKVALYLKEIAFIGDLLDEFLHIVRQVRIVWY